MTIASVLPLPLVALWRAFVAAMARRQQRRMLLALDERALRDIGISRCDAEREAAKGWR